MSRKKLFYIGFFVVLAVGFYIALTYVIPGYARRKVAPVSFVRPFTFTNQDGNKVTEKDVEGKVYVAEYFFTTCTSICPVMNKYMKQVYDAMKDEKDFFILSHTCMPEIDSAAQLKRYADKLGVDTRRWIFLTGRKDSLYNTARISYTLDDPNNNLKSIEDQFMHTQFWALVNRHGDVIKIYDGLKQNEVKELISDARNLLKEE